MPALKVMYFPMSGRAEPTRLALKLGGIDFEDSHPNWAEMKPKVTPLQLPLLEVEGKLISQSSAQTRYACKLAKFEGKPLYPEDPYQALLVDELVDKVYDFMAPLMPTFVISDQKEKEAKRAELMVKGSPSEKWASHIDSVLAKSTSGFAVGDSLTMADLAIFLFINSYRGGYFDGIPANCLDHLTHIKKHQVKIANIPQVKDYYKTKEGPAYAAYKA
ncbi:Glutathione S-transferase 1 [Diplonema papillatum]|nr:Glutathione S-transferase 1 [Diplonema papillatum]